MSCDYDLHCNDCNDSTALSLNHAGAEFELILAHRGALTAYGKAFVDLSTVSYFDDGGGRVHRCAIFLAKHEGHHVVVRDEYGRVYNTCGKRIVCTACDANHYCKLGRDHSGPCSPKLL